MSDQLPRKRIEPLAPPPGQFDLVLGRARYRRHRRMSVITSVSAVFLAGIAGGLTLAGGVTGVQQTVSDFAEQAARGGDISDGSTSPDEPNNSASDKPGVDGQKGGATSTPAVANSPVPPTVTFNGRAVGPAGQPAAGLYIYPGLAGARGFVLAGRAVGVTADDGSYSIPCPNAPVLLAPWPINAEGKAKARVATWGATFVGGATAPSNAIDAPCTRSEKVVETVVTQGSAILGIADVPDACDDEALTMWVWLHGDRTSSIYVQRLHDGDAFRIGGLPAGQHTLGAHGNRTKVTVGGGDTFEQDVRFSCEEGGDGLPKPTASAPSLPAPTGTATELPTGETSTGTSTGTPDPNGPGSSPSSSATGSPAP